MAFSNDIDDQKNTRHVTLSDDIAELLIKEADSEGVTPDDLLNDIIRKRMLSGFLVSKADYIEILNPDFDIFLKLLTTSDIKQIAREQAERNFDGILRLLRGKPGNLGSIIERFYKIYGRYTGWFDFKYCIIKNGLRITLSHTHGIKWSIFLSEYNGIILSKLCTKIESKIQSDAVILDVLLNDAAAESYRKSHENT